MAAAYAGLVSLLNTMDQINNHPRLSTSFDNHQFESVQEKVDFFLDFMENYSDADNKEAEDLVRLIGDVAHEAEDIIEVHAADRIRAAASTQQCPTFLIDLQKIIEDMDLITENVIKAKEQSGFINRQLTYSMPSPSSSSPPSTTMVGFDSYVEEKISLLVP